MEKVQWTWKKFNGHGKSSMDMEKVQWTWKKFNGHGKSSISIQRQPGGETTGVRVLNDGAWGAEPDSRT